MQFFRKSTRLHNKDNSFFDFCDSTLLNNFRGRGQILIELFANIKTALFYHRILLKFTSADKYFKLALWKILFDGLIEIPEGLVSTKKKILATLISINRVWTQNQLTLWNFMTRSKLKSPLFDTAFSDYDLKSCLIIMHNYILQIYYFSKN